MLSSVLISTEQELLLSEGTQVPEPRMVTENFPEFVIIFSLGAFAADDEKKVEAGEAATVLLGLPWELLHDGRGYLFQGGRPVLVRRRLPNDLSLEGAVSEPPIRILLVSPRPEDDKAGYIRV